MGLFYGPSDSINLIIIVGGKGAFSHNSHNSNGPGNAKFMQPCLLCWSEYKQKRGSFRLSKLSENLSVGPVYFCCHGPES